MKSLYGDLPPTTHSEEGEVVKKTLNIFNNPTHYVELNKDVITPVVVQRNIKDQNHQKNEEEPNVTDNLNDHNTYTTSEITQPLENKHEESNVQKKKTNWEEEPTKEVPTEILNINQFVQNDLKKISERLHKLNNAGKDHVERDSNAKIPQEDTNVVVTAMLHNLYYDSEMNELGTMNIMRDNSMTYEYHPTYSQNHPMETELHQYLEEHNANELLMMQEPSSFVKEDELGITQIETFPKNENTHTQQSIGIDPYTNINTIDEETFEMLMNTNKTFQKYFIINENEDYDPAKPNSVNHIIRERKRRKMSLLKDHKKRLEKMQKEIEQEIEKQKMDSFERYIREKDEQYQEDTDENIESNYEKGKYKKEEKDNSQDQGYSDMEVEEYSIKRSEHKIIDFNKMEEAKPKKDFATRMMEKMGWRKGEGLGREKQGITAPLILQKVDKRTGVIIQAPDIMISEQTRKIKEDTFENDKETNIYDKPKDVHKSRESQSHKVREINKSSVYKRIVCLYNIVTPKEIHNYLKKEIKEKVSKHGKVVNIHIRVKSNAKKNDVKAVKIYCEYESKEQAIQAIPLLNERRFLGRNIKAYGIDKEEYEKYYKPL